MSYELWGTPDRTSLTFSGADAISEYKRQGAIEPEAEFIWAVEADSDNEAMTLYHEHMGWEPYKLMEK
jgi:hypothetical protein